MARIWEQIAQSGLCEPARLPRPYGGVLLSSGRNPNDRWLVGPHPVLNRLAKQLRHDETLCDLLRARRVHFGFRSTDVPPLSCKQQKSYGDTVSRPVADHSKQRRESGHQAVRSDAPPPKSRITDALANVEAYWSTQSPQAHHIVEFNNLEEVGVSRRLGLEDLDYDRLPCALFVAEFHQRYISSLLKETHNWRGQPAQLLARLRRVYENIYRKQAPSLLSLWRISEVILNAAEQALRGKNCPKGLTCTAKLK